MNDLAHRIANLSPEKRELLLQRLNAQTTEASVANEYTIQPYDRDHEYYSLTYEQERLWVLAQFGERLGAAYHITLACRLLGKLDIPALDASFNALIHRHESLRIRIVTRAGQPWQQIVAPSTFHLRTIDLINSPAKTDLTIEQHLTTEAQQPFDLAVGPLMRASLYLLDDTVHVLAITLHHIIFDGWSIKAFWNELDELYRARRAQQKPQLPSLPVQYIDYTQWQREHLTEAVVTKHLAYWKKQLADIPSLLTLPLDKARPSEQSFNGRCVNIQLSPALTTSLRTLARQSGATLFTTLLATFKVLLFRYTGQDDIVVGIPEGNRQHIELENLIGFCVNTLILRTQIVAQMSFRALLAQVQATTVAAYTHRDMPFIQLVRALQPERRTSYNPLYQVMFSLQSGYDSPENLFGIRAESLSIDNEAAQVDLSLMVRETADQLTAAFVYNCDLFEAPTIQRLARHWSQLVEAIGTSPDTPLEYLPILQTDEKRQILVEWNRTQRPFPKEVLTPDLFAHQVSLTPMATAVSYADQSLTYQALHNQSNQLAHYLQQHGVTPEARVGLCLPPGLTTVVALLGILKAGGAFVPLDHNAPESRLAGLLAEAQASILITAPDIARDLAAHYEQPAVTDKLKQIYGQQQPPAICTERNWQNNQRQEPVTSSVQPDNLAYVLFTSGSTGRPKGVMISHANLSNYLAWVNETLLGEVDALPANTRLTFDASLKQLLAPLLCGKTVQIPAEETVLKPENMLGVLAQQERGSLNCVPLYWQSILNELETRQNIHWQHHLTDLFLGGDYLEPALVEQTWACLPGLRIWNLYGPTEATANACYDRIMPNQPVTIGRPIANAQVYILDASLQPLPIGVVGELYIGGLGVSRGYSHQPAKTAVSFLPDPFGSVPGRRLYKTGDMCRYRADGRIEFLGRRDRQIKLRGIRIEPGEIEKTLLGHLAVQKAHVLAQSSKLIAYIIPQASQSPTPQQLRTFLQTKLPRFMIPTGFVFLEQFPITAHGKLDIARLQQLTEIAPLPRTIIPARTEVETLLIRMWGHILNMNVELISIEDDFFAIGGHSMLMIQFLGWVKTILHTDVPLSAFLKQPTLAHIGQTLLEHELKPGISEKIAQTVNRLEGLSIAETVKTIRNRQGD